MSMNDLLYPSSYVRADETNIPAWYEFLLNEQLLSKHLLSNDPHPSACNLIKQFFDQASMHSTDTKRSKSLKTLALQTAALLKWNLEIFEKELPIANRHQLLSELMKACKVSMPIAPQNELGSAIENLHDHSIMALVLYCCWGAHTVVKSTFPTKPGGRITPTVPQSVPYQANAQQRSDEIRDQILNSLKEQLVDIVPFLDAVLHHVKRTIYMPSYDTFTSPESFKLKEDPAGIKVSFEELHAQLCFDLGTMHFTHSFYGKAGEMFGHVAEWLKRLPAERSGFCCIDEAKLVGYRTACQMIGDKPVDDDAILMENDNLYLKIKRCLKSKGSALRELGEYIIEDVYKKELSTAFLDQIEREFDVNRNDEYGSDTVFDVKWSNAVRRAVRGLEQPTGLWTFDLNVAQLQRVVGFVQQISAYLNAEETKLLGRFLYSLANNLTDITLREQLLNFAVIKRLIDESDMDDLILRLNAPCLRPLVLENESPASPDNMTSSMTSDEQIAELEHTLIVTFDPTTIKDTLTQLHSATSGRKFSNLCSQWELSNLYFTTISSTTKDALSHDFFSILLVKAHLCCKDSDYSKAKSIVTYLHNNCNSNEMIKLKKLIENELVKLEVLELLNDESLAYSDKEECSELRGQLSDVVSKCRYILSNHSEYSKQSSLPANLTDLCAALLLNLEDLTFFISMTRSASSPPCLLLACMLASVHAGLLDRPAEARKPASELWSASIVIFKSMAAIQASRISNQKKAQLEPIKNLLPPNAVISRPAFTKFARLIKNPAVLQIVVSLLVRLHRLSRTDILSDITCPGSEVIGELWPTGLDGTPVSGPCVTLALRDVLSHCLHLKPSHPGWIRTLADLHYAFNSYGAALKSYLLLGALTTNYFNQISTTGPYEDEQVVQRMIKCCMQMKCYTQAAVLCQLLREVDYPTAFKALQENRDRTDAAELHYFEHFWDVQILEHAAYEHREANEIMKLISAVSASSRPELNHSNAPQVGARVKALRKAKFFQALSRQYLC